jgi:diguanylate cyclase (GGDEF)-like protein
MAGVFSRFRSNDGRGKNPNGGNAPPADAEQHAAALALAREFLHSLEQFVISTPDLDTRRFLQRVRRTADGLTPNADSSTLAIYQNWVENALPVFADLQRQYVSDREEEMWRLLEAYGRAVDLEHHKDHELVASLLEAHERMRALVALPDIIAARRGLEDELKAADRLLELKARQDRERAAALERQLGGLESALEAARGRADYDALTGVYHRGIFQERFQQIFEQEGLSSLALIDVDNFRQINETLGHSVGDRILVIVSEQLRRITRSTDLASRWGGDEFCFFSQGFTPEQLAKRLAPAIVRRHVRIEMDQRACSVLLSVSVGIAQRFSGDTPAALLRRADEALSQARQSAKGEIRIARAPAG